MMKLIENLKIIVEIKLMRIDTIKINFLGMIPMLARIHYL